MSRPATAPERTLTAAWVLLTAAWCAVAMWLIVSFSTGRSGGSIWIIRLLMMLWTGVLTTGLVVGARVVWRRILAMPLRPGRLNGWIARRPWWHVALYYWFALGLLPLVLTTIVEHRAPSGVLLGILLPGQVIAASFLGLMSSVIWRRQAENSASRSERQIEAEPG